MAKIDWPSIEVEYLAGVKSIRAIADEYSCTDTAIRKKAKADGWVRNPTKAKREQVKARLASGSQNGSHESSQEEVRTKINEAVDEDVRDMNLALSNARAALVKVGNLIPGTKDVRDLKTLSETNKLNMEVIRRVRGLDDDKGGGDEDLGELMKIIASSATEQGVIR